MALCSLTPIYPVADSEKTHIHTNTHTHMHPMKCVQEREKASDFMGSLCQEGGGGGGGEEEEEEEEGGGKNYRRACIHFFLIGLVVVVVVVFASLSFCISCNCPEVCDGR